MNAGVLPQPEAELMPSQGLALLEEPSAVRSPRVNLLPPEILEQRRVRVLATKLAGVVVAVAVGVAGGYVWAGSGAAQAQSDLVSARAVQSGLQRQVVALAPAKQAQTQVQNAQKALAAAMGNEVLWSRYMDQLRLTRPDGVRFTSVAFAPVSATSGSAAGAANGSTAGGGAPTATTGALATLTISGKARSQPDVAALLDQLAGVKGFTGVYLSNTTSDASAGLVTFSVTASVTADALSHRYTGDGN